MRRTTRPVGQDRVMTPFIRHFLLAAAVIGVTAPGFIPDVAWGSDPQAAPNAAAPALPAGSTESLAAPLEPLRPFIGKTWRGEMAASTPEKPMVDISRWERALNGQAVRVLHSINNGEYGGESIIYWDPKLQSLAFYYFTTAGFHTNGTMKFENGKFSGSEAVTGAENGITEVRSTSEVLADGRLHSKAEYLQNGQWVPGHEITYVPDPAAQVVFR